MLVARARSDREAFGLLYDRYLDPVYRYCYRRLQTPEAAEDATSLVFAKALAGLPRYRDNGPSFRSWLFAIAHNVITDDLRSRRTMEPLSAAEEIADRSSPEEEAIVTDVWRTLGTLLAHLSPDDRHLVELRLAGLTDAEIGVVLGKSRGAIKVAHHRAVVRMRGLLGIRKGGAPDA
jgi:RNA polymerase sigma-70 factor (ECF subfamily)